MILKSKDKELIINKTRSDRLPLIAGLLAKNKEASYHLLKRAGLPVPEYMIVSARGAELLDFLNRNPKWVVKPMDASRSLGVAVGMEKEADLDAAITTAKLYSEQVIVQKYITGYDYRVLVIDGAVAGVLEYQPAYIEGDGDSTIKQLIEGLNEGRLGRNGADEFEGLEVIRSDSERLLLNLHNQGKALQDVPVKGEQVQLFYSEDITADEITEIVIDRTEEICTANAEMAIQAAGVLKIDVAGIDIRCKDISLPLNRENEGILEVNALPDLTDHVFPFCGKSRDVAGAYLQYLFKGVFES
ncbi:ATP-grasp domain-containing protein [Paenibacillus sp. P96]|uniref:ATP-grasp domain-containing protein n=1 Tax=Paenibacillus zeirhizosphaerae TaxID=2987519 RepID=A0ABT9FRV9_9BACL|nr:ATP-grasp domain-containing protein [Paenibacillus sp. P96]MDP4097197.1 ATP-grasp domain-containing protein [Paenibacillus sp. P96]